MTRRRRGRDKGAASRTHSSSERTSASGTWLEWIASPKGTAAVALGGLAVSLASFLTGTSITRLSIFGPPAFALLVVLAWRTSKRLVAAAALVLLLGSVVLVVRAYSNPGTVRFWYGGQIMDTTVFYQPLPDGGAIPLTANPAEGSVDETIYPGDATEFEVSCTRSGTLSTNQSRMGWARIETGKYQTFWVPMPLLRGLAPGSARTLLPCSNWRWQLQNLGDP